MEAVKRYLMEVVHHTTVRIFPCLADFAPRRAAHCSTHAQALNVIQRYAISSLCIFKPVYIALGISRRQWRRYVEYFYLQTA